MRNAWNAIVAAVIALAACVTTAADYPGKPVRIITGSNGALPDIVTRHLAPRLHERWGQPVVVENRAGAGLVIGTAIAAKAPPDGYTLIMSDRTALASAPSLY